MPHDKNNLYNLYEKQFIITQLGCRTTTKTRNEKLYFLFIFISNVHYFDIFDLRFLVQINSLHFILSLAEEKSVFI